MEVYDTHGAIFKPIQVLKLCIYLKIFMKNKKVPLQLNCKEQAWMLESLLNRSQLVFPSGLNVQWKFMKSTSKPRLQCSLWPPIVLRPPISGRTSRIKLVKMAFICFPMLAFNIWNCICQDDLYCCSTFICNATRCSPLCALHLIWQYIVYCWGKGKNDDDQNIEYDSSVLLEVARDPSRGHQHCASLNILPWCTNGAQNIGPQTAKLNHARWHQVKPMVKINTSVDPFWGAPSTVAWPFSQDPPMNSHG